MHRAVAAAERVEDIADCGNVKLLPNPRESLRVVGEVEIGFHENSAPSLVSAKGAAFIAAWGNAPGTSDPDTIQR
jgi:hypothetical protein